MRIIFLVISVFFAYFGLTSFVWSQTHATYILGNNMEVSFNGTLFPKASTIDKFSFNWTDITGAHMGVFDFANHKGMGIMPNGTYHISLSVNFGNLTSGSGPMDSLMIPSGARGHIIAKAGGTVVVVSNLLYTVQRALTVIDPVSGALVRGDNVTQTIQTIVVSVEPAANTSLDLSTPNAWNVALFKLTPQQWTVYGELMVSGVKIANVTGYYELTVSGTASNKALLPSADPLYLSVGLKVGSVMMPSNQYSIVQDMDLPITQFIVHDGTLDASVSSLMINQFSLANFSITDGGVPKYWWLVAQQGLNAYALTCDAVPIMNHHEEFVFEWKVVGNDGSKNGALQVGIYNLYLLYSNGMNATFRNEWSYPQKMMLSHTLTVQRHGQEKDIVINHEMQNLTVTPGQMVSVSAQTIYKKLYFQWQISANTSVNNNGTWKNLSAVTVETFTPGVSKMVSLQFPSNASDLNGTRLFVRTYACDGMTVLSKTFVKASVLKPSPSPTGAPSNSGSKGLGPGAIVGIVCAAVFVCGVVAWWFCMRNSANKDRYTRLEQ